MRTTAPRWGAPVRAPRTGTRPREPKVFSTSKGMSMAQTSLPSSRLTSARKRLTAGFDSPAFDAFAAFAPALFVADFFVAIRLLSRERHGLSGLNVGVLVKR